MIRSDILNPELKFILKTLENAGYEAYIVGGCVRDFLMNRKIHDFDITTNALPEKVTEIFSSFKVIPTGIKHGTVTVIYHDRPFEITTFRIDGSYSDSRRPDTVEFTSSLTDDLSRRDFTMNAIAMDRNGNIYDHFGGAEDIKKGIIRCVGDPEKRFTEDALRILRAVRFSSQLGFKIESETSETLFKLKQRLDFVSRERVREELDKIIFGENCIYTMMTYREIIAQIVPEIRESFDFQQHSRYHKYDVYEHTVRAVDSAITPFLKRVMFFHDIGKPAMFRLDEKGTGHFKHHAEYGAEMTKNIMKRLKYDNKTINVTYELIYRHSDKIMTERQAMQTVSEIGADMFFMLMQVKRADNYAKNEFVLQEHEVFSRIEENIKRMIENNVCMSISQLAVNGNDISELGIKGQKIGNTLKILLGLVMDGAVSNDREELISYTKENLI